MTTAVRFDQVSKRYGNHQALKDFSLEIPEGGIFGLVGRNGSGKSTALRILLGLARPDTGSVTLLDNAPDKRIGYAPEIPGQYDWMTGREYLTLGAGLAAVPENLREQRISALLERVQLDSGDARISTYSIEMRQQLGIAFAMIGGPDLLILDETTSALDPGNEHNLVQIISEFRNETTILFASHVLRDIEKIADHIGIIENGQMIVRGTLTELQMQFGLQPRTELVQPSLEDILAGLAGDTS